MPCLRPSLVVSFISLLAVSCTVRELEIKDAPSYGDDVFYASLESYSEPETKVYLDENIKILWDAKDQISIFNLTNRNQQFEFAGKTGDNAGAFNPVSSPSGPEESLSYICAVYPYQSSTTINKEGVLTLTLPAEQTYRKDSFGPGTNTMVSATEDHLLKFKNVGGYLALKFYGEGVSVASVKIEGNNNELLAGKAKLKPAVGEVPSIIEMEKNAGTSITLLCENPVKLEAKKEDATIFWMVVPPTDFTKGFKLTVTDSDGNQFVKETSSNLSIARNGVLRISPLRVVTKPIKYAKTSTLSVGSSYLIVDATDERLLKGATDGSFKSISPEDGVITDTDGSFADFEFTVENDNDKYYLRFNDGKYLVCDYNNDGKSGLAYVDSPADVEFPYVLSTGANGAFFFSTTQVNDHKLTNQVLYYKSGTGSGANIFKIGGSGTSIGVHLYMKGGKLDRNLSFNPTSVTCYADETPEKPVLSGTFSTVTYTSSDESVATVNANGDVNVIKHGTVTITASVEEDDLHNAASASYTLMIKKRKTTDQYERVTNINQVNTQGEYVIVYDDGSSPKVFKPILNAGKNAFLTTSDNAVDVIIDDDEIEAADVDDCRIQLANQENRKFSLVVPEADGTVNYYLVVYRSPDVFLASTTETGYRTTFELTSEGKLNLKGHSSYNFLYSSGAFKASLSASSNLYLFVRTGEPVKQKQTLSFREESVIWTLGDNYELNGYYDPQQVDGAQTDVTYTAEPESVVKIENGQIKIIGAGTATITATAAKSDQYFAASASYSLRIRNAAGGWVDLGAFSLENAALTAYLNDAESSYTDTNDDTFTVMNKYVSGTYASIDRKDCPAPVTITWDDPASNSTVITIYEDKTLVNKVCSQSATNGTTSAEVYNLIPGLTYYYTVSEGSEILEKGYFSTTGRRRMLKVSNTKGRGYANNCRDLGGLIVSDHGQPKTIKYGYLFRGTNMDKTTQAVEWPILLDFMNIGRDIDLRNGETDGTNFGSEGSQNRYRPLPTSIDYTAPGFKDSNNFPDLTVKEKVYEVVMAFFNTVKSGKAVYFHCYSGADRTGYIAMLIEGLLGVSEKDCSIDYELTSFSVSGKRYRIGQDNALGSQDYDFRDGIKFLRELPGTTFQNKIETYLVGTVGISQQDIDDFKSRILE